MFAKKTELKRLKIYQIIKVCTNIHFWSKIGFPHENTYNRANFQASMPFLFLYCQKYQSSTIYCLQKIIQTDSAKF